ncbi:soluble NSF attachment family protein [Aporhodopirellula aestuarii]|uniref:Soluble NSF attachment family protein n=1 Tax=Aporhodopirellula aestuarii TaxID=2950107 RepID=A0ABT0U4W9_9BACT|nr:soluble NSF attachment family protein [Aporhodopirellula aestuarii]MCM2371605.1 soluble NSF attachment family protein [Aporhodopirellula aestuarii]
MKLTLRPTLCFDDSPHDSGVQTGCWLPDADIGTQVEFMIRCGGNDQDAVAFYSLPSLADTAAPNTSRRGILALPLSERSINGVPGTVKVKNLLATGRRTTPKKDSQTAQCWIASHSRLDPECPADWLAEALPSGEAVVCVWLPRLGLIVLEPSDRFQLAQCLRPPSTQGTTSHWTPPPPTTPLPQRLAGLQLLEPMTIDQLLGPSGLGGDAADIGQDASELFDQPSDRGGTPKTGRFKKWILNKLDKLAGSDDATRGDQTGTPNHSPSGLPASGSGQTADSGAGSGVLRSISAGLFGLLSRSVAQEREEQLNKLLKMSRLDPDRALRFAIPLAGADAFRGLAIPGAKLMSRLPNFSLSGISGGSGPADVWDIDHSTRQRLIAAYHEMANRESAAGRYRRAAYIHANLLGNFSAAANVLEQGGYFQEAEVLYRDKLHRPADAARCLMSAGLFEQAAHAFAKLNEYEKECDAWRRAGDEEQAIQSLERAVKSLCNVNAIHDAAKLIDTLLHDRQRAIKLLVDQWPYGNDLKRCATQAFTWWADAGEHQTAIDHLRTFVETTTDGQRRTLVELTHHLARRYPDRNLQRLAEDQCRVAASQIIQRDNNDQTIDKTLAILKTLDKENPLLASDVHRFASTRLRNSPAKTPAATTRQDDGRIQRLSVTSMPVGRYVAYQMVNDELFAVSQMGLALYVMRVPNPADNTSSLEETPTVQVKGLIPTFLNNPPPVGVIASGNEIYLRFDSPPNTIPPLRLKSTTHADDWTIHWRWPGTLQSSDAAVSDGGNSFATIETENSQTVLTRWTSAGLALRTTSLTSLIESSTGWNIDDIEIDPVTQSLQLKHGVSPPLFSPPARSTSHIAFLENAIVVAAGSTLIVDADSPSGIAAAVDYPINGISVSPRSTRRRIAVAHEGGLNVYWWETGELHCQKIASDQPIEHVLWMRGGRLFAVSGTTLFRYQINRQSSTQTGKTFLFSEQVRALLPLSTGVCCVASSSGRIECF